MEILSEPSSRYYKQQKGPRNKERESKENDVLKNIDSIPEKLGVNGPKYVTRGAKVVVFVAYWSSICLRRINGDSLISYNKRFLNDCGWMDVFNTIH